MRVGFDVSSFFAGMHNGTSVYMYRLLTAMLDVDPNLRLTLLYNHKRSPASDKILASLAGPRVDILRGGLRRTGVPRAAYWMPRFPTVRRMIGAVDVFHGNDTVFPRPDGTPMIVTVLDLIPQLFPAYSGLTNRLRDRRKLRWAARHADRVIAISQSTKNDFCRFCGFDASRVDVTPLARGTDPEIDLATSGEMVEGVRTRFGLGDFPYILSVGAIEPRKNLPRLVEAFAGVAARLPDVRLVIAGPRGWKMSASETAIATSLARARIHVIGSVPAEHLATLYAGAAAFAFPSLYEGFGLPVLEAMAAGVPVVTSNVSSLPEIVGDSALLVDPESVGDIRGALLRLLEDPALRRSLGERGRARERTFTWRRTAEATLGSYRAAIEQRHRPNPELLRSK